MWTHRHRKESRFGPDARGFTLIELLIVVAIIGLITAIAVTSMRRARLKSEINALAEEARQVYVAFNRFYIDSNHYPNATSSPSFQLDSFEPLRGAGYYRGNVVVRLTNGRADSYDSPDDMGSNREFWLVMTSKADPGVRFLVANSDDTPFGADWYDGVYMFDGGSLTPVEKYEP